MTDFVHIRHPEIVKKCLGQFPQGGTPQQHDAEDNKYEKSACSNPQKRKKGESFCASGVFVLMQDKLPGTDGDVQEVEDNGKGIG